MLSTSPNPYGINAENADIDNGPSPYGINMRMLVSTVVLVHMESIWRMLISTMVLVHMESI